MSMFLIISCTNTSHKKINLVVCSCSTKSGWCFWLTQIAVILSTIIISYHFTMNVFQRNKFFVLGFHMQYTGIHLWLSWICKENQIKDTKQQYTNNYQNKHCRYKLCFLAIYLSAFGLQKHSLNFSVICQVYNQ